MLETERSEHPLKIKMEIDTIYLLLTYQFAITAPRFVCGIEWEERKGKIASIFVVTIDFYLYQSNKLYTHKHIPLYNIIHYLINEWKNKSITPNKNDWKSTKKIIHNNDNIQVASDIAHKLNTLVNVWQQLFHRDKNKNTQTRLNGIIFEVMMTNVRLK